jgi:glycosyltransferase involved in cell wall biosynthesis
MKNSINSQVGVVVIGRNEGERLKRCLQSLVSKIRRVVYVDSGSTDGSVEFAESLSIDVVNLDMSTPFTMARGRNAGFTHLIKIDPKIPYVQFVDGDCEVVDAWINKACGELDNRSEVAVVCGRRRERFPDATIYNRYCDMEWNLPLGELDACGGDAMMRCDAFRQTHGFNPTMIAGEEAELCFRIRQQGWKIVRLDEDMTIHDAAITKFAQFWKRNVRSGHAYAERVFMHKLQPERTALMRPLKSAIIWGGILPALYLIFLLGSFWDSKALIIVCALSAVYLLQGYRIFRYRRKCRDAPNHALCYAILCLILKLPELVGILTFVFNRARGQQTSLIEYKGKTISRSTRQL